MYSKPNLRAGYYQLRMREGEEFKAAFKTYSSHFKYLVMPCPGIVSILSECYIS